jgi:hypothetical protein
MSKLELHLLRNVPRRKRGGLDIRSDHGPTFVVTHNSNGPR